MMESISSKITIKDNCSVVPKCMEKKKNVVRQTKQNKKEMKASDRPYAVEDK